MSVIDEVSPIEYGEARITLTLDSGTPTPQAFDEVLVNVDYSRTLPEGIVLPLEMTISGPSGAAVFKRTVFTRIAPTQLAFLPSEGGSHLVRLAEQNHNRWHGELVVDVEGTSLQENQS